MGFYDGPVIINSGLVLSLDAADRNSYPSSGTAWSDLSGNNNNGTLTNGPTFNGANGGSIVFDGTNDYAPISTTNFPFGASAGTLSAWARTNNSTSFSWILSYGTAGTGQSRFLGVGSNLYYFGGFNGVDITASGVVASTWFNITGVYTGTQALLYINGVLAAGPTNLSWNTVANNAQIGRQTNGGEYWNGNVSLVQIYNRVLSATEVSQNYNAQKSRFGL